MAGPRRLPRKCWRAAPPQRPHRRDLTDSSLRAAAFPSECSGTDALPLQRSGASPCTTTEPSYHEATTQGSSPPASLTVSATPPPSVPPDSRQLLGNSPPQTPTSALAPEHSKSTHRKWGGTMPSQVCRRKALVHLGHRGKDKNSHSSTLRRSQTWRQRQCPSVGQWMNKAWGSLSRIF